jgi:hypothetical protein
MKLADWLPRPENAQPCRTIPITVIDKSRTHNRKRGIARLIAYNIAVLGLLLVIVEGLASYALLARDIIKTQSVAEQRYTQYDADLGWVSKPNLHIPDMFGPGIYLRTNAQRFRSNHDTTNTVPGGKARIICSGDSYTLGYGVDNAHTWCELLSSLEPRVETVNMGQGGYGVDQAYLWYKRDAVKIEHQVQILAFITNDFDRMQSDSFGGYPKPVPEVENDTLVVKNVPVPKLAFYSLVAPRSRAVMRQLRTVDFMNRALEKLGVTTTDTEQLSKRGRNDNPQEVLHKILDDLRRLNEQRSSKLVLVYLPAPYELEGEGPEEWTPFLEHESMVLGVPFFNLFSEFRSLPANERAKLFSSGEHMPYWGAGGHFNEAGNELAAKAIYSRLLKAPVIVDALSARWNHR